MINNFKPTLGVESNDKYDTAKIKLIELLKILNELTLAQSNALANELLTAMGIATSLDSLIDLMNNGGNIRY